MNNSLQRRLLFISIRAGNGGASAVSGERRGRDSNPRSLAGNTLSKRAR